MSPKLPRSDRGRQPDKALLIGELEEERAEDGARAEAAGPAGQGQARARERKHPVRKPLPAHLPREVVTHDPPCTCPGCGGSVFSRVGQDEREVLEYVPSSFKVIRHVRPPLPFHALRARNLGQLRPS